MTQMTFFRALARFDTLLDWDSRDDRIVVLRVVQGLTQGWRGLPGGRFGDAKCLEKAEGWIFLSSPRCRILLLEPQERPRQDPGGPQTQGKPV